MFRVFFLVLMSIVCHYAIQGSVVEKFVTGKVTHNGQKQIPKNSRVEVLLQDTSLMDAPAKEMGTTVITDATSFPIPYKVKYNAAKIVRGHTYSVTVRITGPDGSLQYINDVRHNAELSGENAPALDVAVIRVGGSPTGGNPGKNDGKKTCPPVKCRGKTKACPYGYHKKDGCEICKCNDPCNPPGKPILCGPKQRCFVDKKPDGSFGTRCGTVSSGKDKDGHHRSKAICQEPKVVGMCMAAFDRFYYNPATKSCEKFIYGGCGGNDNNFETKPACEKACKA